ncbi:vascular endothelial growth factor A-like [Penaeus monodon]|uniref:vascular endothelial growth factor A-like n=1 Tax=Penaeus monodon TaxID=6687 RepID=UPI0018A769F0|nr:vascular endothelial growth factor A-like [Penaeus monodon]
MHGARSTILALALAILGTSAAFEPIFGENAMFDRDLFLEVNEAEREPKVKSYDLSFLTFEQQDLLKSVASIGELANLTGLPLLDEDPSHGLRIGFRSLSPPVRTRSRRQYEKLPACKPRTVTEPVEQHHNGVRTIPTCIERKVCGGCCSAGRLCVPTKTKGVTKKVIQLGTNTATPVFLNVTEDEECECVCKIKASDCSNSQRQEYDHENCMCKCKSSLKAEKDMCESLGNFWDYNNCRCACRSLIKRECSSGYYFDELTCNCVPIFRFRLN